MSQSFNGIPPAEVITYDKGALSLLTRRESKNPQDDHFDSPVISPKWLNFRSFSSFSLSIIPGWVSFASSSNGNPSGLIQPIVSAPFTIETEQLIGGEGGAVNWGGSGLILTNSSNYAASLACAFMMGGRASAGLARMCVTKFTNGGYTSNYLEVLSSLWDMHMWFKIYRNGTTNYFYYSASYGKTWHYFYGITDASMGFTPTYFGIFGLYDVHCNYFLRY